MANLININTTRYGNETHAATDTGLSTEGVIYASLADLANDGTKNVEIIYADTMADARPIKVVTDATALSTLAGKSNQLVEVTVTKKNGVAYSSGNTLVINLERVILGYINTDGGTAWTLFYDASRNNMAGLDSPHVDILEISTDLTADAAKFISHIGALDGPDAGVDALVDLESIKINGQVVAFPDVTASGVIRVKNIANAYESASKTYIKMKAVRSGYAEVVVGDTLANVVGATDSTNVAE